MSDPAPSRYAISLDALQRSSQVAPEDRVEEVPDAEVPTDLPAPPPVWVTTGWAVG